MLSGCARGEAAQRVGDVELDGRAEVDPAGQDDLVDAAAADRAGELADEAVPRLAVRVLADDGERRDDRPGDHPVGARLELPGAPIERRPTPVEAGGRRDGRGGQGRAGRRCRNEELREHERGRPERGPDLGVVRASTREPEAAHQDGARIGDPRGAQQLAPGPLRIGEAIGPLEGGRPCPPDADEGRPLRRPEPQGRLEIGLDGRREQRDGVDRRHRGGRGGEGAVRIREPLGQPRVHRRHADVVGPRARPDGRHRTCSGKSAPSAIAGSGTAAILGSPTPTDRSRIARRAG